MRTTVLTGKLYQSKNGAANAQVKCFTECSSVTSDRSDALARVLNMAESRYKKATAIIAAKAERND